MVEGALVCTGDYPDGKLGEIFISYQKVGSFAQDMLNAFAIALSLGLQHGIPLKTLHHTYRDFKMEPDLVRGIFEELELRYPEVTV